MSTVDQFVDQVSSLLHSYTGTLEAATYLKQALDSTSTTVQVAHPSYITRGLIECGYELMHVDAVGDTSATLMPFGRGVQGTQALPHAINSKVTNDPLFPRQAIMDAFGRCLQSVQLDLYQVKTTTFTYVTVQTSYEIPADVTRVLSVQYELVGPTKEWANVTHWDVDYNADTATGKALVIHEWIQAGRTVQITYAAELPTPVTPQDDLASMGIPDWMLPVMLYGTAWEMVQFLEPARLQLKSVEARTQAANDPPGSASNLAKSIYAMYQLRLEQARKRLLTTHPSPKHYVRY